MAIANYNKFFIAHYRIMRDAASKEVNKLETTMEI